MPERLECEVLQKEHYKNPLTFTFYLYNTARQNKVEPSGHLPLSIFTLLGHKP